VKYRVFSTTACPKCEQLKTSLKRAGLEFESLDMATPEALTELRINGVFSLAAPVLQVDESFYTVQDLFDGEMLKDLSRLLKG
jgi:glutaredoxin